MSSRLIEFPIGHQHAHDACPACGEPKANLVITGEVRIYACKCGHRWDASNAKEGYLGNDQLKKGWYRSVVETDEVREQIRLRMEKIIRDAILKGSR